MSMERKDKVKCPKCGHMQDFVIWHSLNGDIDPDAKQQLLDGSLFRFECEECGHNSSVNYAMLYHDMANRVMVHYVSEDSVEQAKATMNDAENKFSFVMTGYRRRIVTDQNALREKAIIFDCGLDDRVIEIIKLIFYVRACRQFPENDISAVYFLVSDDNKCILEFIGDNQMSAEVPPEMYEEIKSDFAERLDAAGDKELIIDAGWAAEIFKG